MLSTSVITGCQSEASSFQVTVVLVVGRMGWLKAHAMRSGLE